MAGGRGGGDWPDSWEHVLIRGLKQQAQVRTAYRPLALVTRSHHLTDPQKTVWNSQSSREGANWCNFQDEKQRKQRGGEKKEVQPVVFKTSSLKEEFKMRGGLWGQSCSELGPLESETSTSEAGLERLGGGWEGSRAGRRLGSHLESQGAGAAEQME